MTCIDCGGDGKGRKFRRRRCWSCYERWRRVERRTPCQQCGGKEERQVHGVCMSCKRRQGVAGMRAPDRKAHLPQPPACEHAEGCDRKARTHRLCPKHYAESLRRARGVAPRVYAPKVCAVNDETCSTKGRIVRGHCSRHYRALLKVEAEGRQPTGRLIETRKGRVTVVHWLPEGATHWCCPDCEEEVSVA